MQKLADFILSGYLPAILVAGLCAALSIYLLPSSYVTPIPYLGTAALGLVALRKGWQPALITATCAALVGLLAIFISTLKPGFHVSIVYALWLGVLPCAWVLQNTESQGAMTVTAGLLGTLFVVGMYLLTGDASEWWRGWLSSVVNQVPGATRQGFEQDTTLELLNGAVGLIYVLGITVSMLLARWWQSLLFNPGGFKAEFYALRIPKQVLYWVTAVGTVFWLLEPGVAIDFVLVCLAIYVVHGLAFLHALAGEKGTSSALVALPYILLVLMPLYAVIGLSLIGITDSLIHFRSKQADTEKHR